MADSRSRPPARVSLKGERVSVSGEVPGSGAGGSAAGAVKDRFALQQLLGQGGMGSVFVAQDRGLGRFVALKLLRDELGSDQGALRRFVLEAQIGAQLEHPNIVPLYSFERTEAGAPAITMQLLEGQTMAAYIDEAAAASVADREPRGKFNLKERISTLLGVCDAIHFAHERGVIHRDLKPDNVMLGTHREVYVMDWGLARVIGGPEPVGETRPLAVAPPLLAPNVSHDELASLPTIASQGPVPSAIESHEIATLPTVASQPAANPDSASLATQQGQVMGTPQYMPPEQAIGLINELGPAADQYALGVMLQELACLRPARSHTNLMQALAQAVQGFLAEPVDVDGRHPHPALLAII
ncbi:MAG TPA: protein kinase, partial [Polyangiaceae bacterium]|nr:protein kinase [Polyangiaceae bacterium]